MTSFLDACYKVQIAPPTLWYSQSTLISLFIWIVHYFSAFLTVGAMVVITLRVLGVAVRGQTITQVSKIYSPWMWVGLTAVTTTGLLLLFSDATSFCANGVFGVSLLVTALATISGIVVTRKAAAWDVPSGPPANAKLFATLSLLLWLGT